MSELLGGWMRSGMCADFRKEDVGKEITVMGWVNSTRNLGGLIFMWLRDRSGMIQVMPLLFFTVSASFPPFLVIWGGDKCQKVVYKYDMKSKCALRLFILNEKGRLYEKQNNETVFFHFDEFCTCIQYVSCDGTCMG